MVDILSVAVGVFVGGCIGFIWASVRGAVALDELNAKYEKLYREHSRLTTRGPGGRFTKVK